MHLRISRALQANFDKEEGEQVAREDWDADMAGKGEEMDYQVCVRSVLHRHWGNFIARGALVVLAFCATWRSAP